MTAAFLIAAKRTPVAPRNGALSTLDLEALTAPLVHALLATANIPPDAVDDVILSNAIGPGGNPARRVALAAGLPERIAGLTTDRQCAGGLDAILLARAMIMAGLADCIIAGGAESHSRRPERRHPGATEPYDQAPFTPWPDRDPLMAEAAARLATRLGISREMADRWAVDSHSKALAADLTPEIVPLNGLAKDSFTRPLTPALAARAKVVAGPVTAANTAVAADGAALVLVVSDRLAARAPRALRIAAGATLGATPWEPGTAPLPAIAKSLADARLAPHDLRQAEVMEAYAVQAIACVTGADLDPAITNPKGGALARGHPIAASGAILATRLFHDLTAGAGLATIAAAGGIGTALILQA